MCISHGLRRNTWVLSLPIIRKPGSSYDRGLTVVMDRNSSTKGSCLRHICILHVQRIQYPEVLPDQHYHSHTPRRHLDLSFRLSRSMLKMPCVDRQNPAGAVQNSCTGSCSRNGGICTSRRDQSSTPTTNPVPQIEETPLLHAERHDKETKAPVHSLSSRPSDRAGIIISRHRPRVIRRAS